MHSEGPCELWMHQRYDENGGDEDEVNPLGKGQDESFHCEGTKAPADG
jgi:hypothetical protein